ncbi:MAG: type transport system ATP-binding protein [Thermotogota bacterium]|nr:type transport system ATP-binding protein [Thermotogota bacterium]
MVVEIREMGKRFKGKIAISSVSFDVEEGSIFVLVGPNGAGKTTTLRCLCGEINPDSGHVKVFGKAPAEVKQKIAVLEESRITFSGLKPSQYEELWNILYPRWNERMFRDLILHFGVDEEKPVSAFSAGMKTLFFFSLTLASGAQLLLLDEPTQGVDVEKKSEILSILRELDDRTIIMSTHQLEEVEWIAESFAIINEGRTVYSDDLEHAKEVHRVARPSELSDEDRILYSFDDGTVLVKTERDIGRYPSFVEIGTAYLKRSARLSLT